MKDISVADSRNDLKEIDDIIVDTPTRFGNMCTQMRNFWNQTGGERQTILSSANPGQFS